VFLVFDFLFNEKIGRSSFTAHLIVADAIIEAEDIRQ